MFAVAVVVAAGFLALSAVTARPEETTPLRPVIEDFVVVYYLHIEQDDDPKRQKGTAPRPVHVLAEDTAVIFARTRGVERLDIVVQLSGTESFGVFSGTPDRNGHVTVEVDIPRGGSWHDFRVPGPEGRRDLGQIRARTVFMLAPYGYVANGIHASGDAIWVRLEE